MRKARTSRRNAYAFAGLAAAGLAAMAGSGRAEDARPPSMHLGAAAPAPPGFLAFCARLPAQCGLSNETDANGQAVSADQLSRTLRSKYYWAAAFSGHPTSLAALSPAASADQSAGTAMNGFHSQLRRDADHRNNADGFTPSADQGHPAQPMVNPLRTNDDLLAQLDRVNLSVNHAIRYVSDKALYGDEDYWHLALGPGEPAAGDCKDYVLEKRRALIAQGVPAADLSIAIVETTWHESHAVLLVSTDRGEMVLDSRSDWVKPWWQVRYSWVERQAPGQQLNWVTIG